MEQLGRSREFLAGAKADSTAVLTLGATLVAVIDVRRVLLCAAR